MTVEGNPNQGAAAAWQNSDIECGNSALDGNILYAVRYALNTL